MMYVVYWRSKQPPRVTRFGYCEAPTAGKAYDITAAALQAGTTITAVYEAHTEPTPQSICINFAAPDYKLF